MSYLYQYSVLPGDKRQEYLIDVLLAKGIRVAYDMQLKTLCEAAPVVLGPVPFLYDFEELSLQSGQLLFGGCLADGFRNACKEKEVTAFDYMSDKEFSIYNAIATAEGTLAEMAKNSIYNLHQNSCLVFGFGICGKAVALRLLALGMEVCICARNSLQRAEAVSMGFDAIPFSDLRGRLPAFLFIVNTVPALVLDKTLLNFVHPECLICDIASKPGGVDFETAKELSITALLLPGLPGIYSPKSSAAYMAAFVLKKNSATL